MSTGHHPYSPVTVPAEIIYVSRVLSVVGEDRPLPELRSALDAAMAPLAEGGTG